MTDFTYVYEVDEIKSKLPIRHVAAQLDVLFGVDLRALCPFHDDRETPNLELMEPGDDGFEWVYCRACGFAGDVVGFIRAMRDCSFYDALVEASRLLDELPADVDPPRLQKRRKYTITPEWDRRVEDCRARAREHEDIGLLSFAYGFTGEHTPSIERSVWDDHLIGWGWGLDEAANVVIPHWGLGQELEVVKVRTREKLWRAYGDFRSLYGAWRGIKHSDALICEGESDAVWSDYQEQGLQVYALPHGADSYHDSWVTDIVEQFDQVYLAFDGDVAGERATARWARGIYEYNGSMPHVLPVRPGTDLRTDGRNLDELLLASVPATFNDHDQGDQ